MVIPIKLNNIEDVRNVNNFAANYDGKSEVHGSLIMVDARSILALMSLIGHKDLTLAFPDHSNPKHIFPMLKKYNLI